ncbi:MAG: enoyl-CoA hydratase/isomerase family protein [Acidimicrobiia bacterium]
MATSEVLVFERRDTVALLTLNRPAQLNAIDGVLHRSIMDALDEIRADDAIRSVVITGAGRAFCAGADVRDTGRARDSVTQNDRIDDLMWFGRQTLALAELDKPTIAAVNGIAAGNGMGIALACDLRVGGDTARFRNVFVERSLCPDSGCTWFLPRIVGAGRAADLIMTSREVGADEAHAIGLLDRHCGGGDPVEAALELAHTMDRWPPTAIRTAKRTLQHAMTSTLRDALFHEAAGHARAQSAPNDAAEAMAAFLEKRPPVYTGT